MNVIKRDRYRYADRRIPYFQIFYRKANCAKSRLGKKIYGILCKWACMRRHIELSERCQIGEGLYFGHAYAITINPNVVIGKNANIHKGVTIGRENRGKRKGTPTIGDFVWIGINSTIVGNITIGNDVLIAPNSYVNCDVPDHSVVFGNPCVIKHRENATQDYVNRTI